MSILLLVFVGIIALCQLVYLSILAFMALSVKRLLDTRVNTALGEVNATLKRVEKLVEKVDDRAERIMDIGEDAVRRVSGSVVATSDVVEDAVASPFISLSGLVAGIARAFAVLRRRPATTETITPAST